MKCLSNSSRFYTIETLRFSLVIQSTHLRRGCDYRWACPCVNTALWLAAGSDSSVAECCCGNRHQSAIDHSIDQSCQHCSFNDHNNSFATRQHTIVSMIKQLRIPLSHLPFSFAHRRTVAPSLAIVLELELKLSSVHYGC